MPAPFLTSIRRIADFERRPPEIEPLDRQRWETGDYVLAEVTAGGTLPYMIENQVGRSLEVIEGDRLIGALGRRAAEAAVRNLSARPAPAGPQPVVLGNAYSGVLPPTSGTRASSVGYRPVAVAGL